MNNAMPNEQADFINAIKSNMLEYTNMTEDEAYEYAFRTWQNRRWLKDYLLNE